jgi:hypothetical protein
LVSKSSSLSACARILAGDWVARVVNLLAVFPCKGWRAVASVKTRNTKSLTKLKLYGLHRDTDIYSKTIPFQSYWEGGRVRA